MGHAPCQQGENQQNRVSAKKGFLPMGFLIAGIWPRENKNLRAEKSDYEGNIFVVDPNADSSRLK
jgi:ribonuclease I